MLTLFSVPKSFRGHIGIIQKNSIRSWLKLSPKFDIILMGNEEGTSANALKFGVRHVPEIERNQYGTPLVSSIFKSAERESNNKLLCYINADIILLGDFLRAVEKVMDRKSKFLIVGHRWDIELNESLGFTMPDWETRLRSYVAASGRLHPHTGIDYFIFPRGVWRKIPPFALGRTAWDNWLIYEVRRRRIPVIDATRVITAIHQNHEPVFRIENGKRVYKREGVEAKLNLALAGGWDHLFTLRDATMIFSHKGLHPAASPNYLSRRLETLPSLFPNGPINLVARMLRSTTKMARLLFRSSVRRK